MAHDVGVLIRRAVPEDLGRVCVIAEAVRLDPEHAQTSGFLVYVHGKSGYADRLSATDLFDVAVHDGEVIGFLVSFEDHTAEEQVRRGILSADVLRAKEIVGCKGRWLYTDQIAVDPAHASHGVAMHLVWDLYLKARKRGIDTVFVAILHEPVNVRSKALAESLGFALRGTVRYRDGRWWGIYSRDVPCAVPAEQASRVATHRLTEA